LNNYLVEIAMDTVTAQDANRHFSALLRKVAQGQEVVVTSRGTPVARMVPVVRGGALRQAARGALLAHLSAQATTGSRGWTRDELYD
jgi:prevent-host-death family protein